MSKTGISQLPLIPKEVDNLLKLVIMEASDVRPSFVCFLPDFQCSPANIIYFNGITESTGIQHRKSVSLSLAKRKSPQGTLDVTSRLSDASLEAESFLINGFAQSRASLAGDVCRMGVVEKGAQHAVHGMATATDLPGLENGESANARDDSSGEIDVLAFEITEFFNAFTKGQEHKLLKCMQTLNLSSPESLLEPEGDQRGAKLSPAPENQHVKSDKVGTPIDGDRIDGRISSSAGRSGKWNGFLDADSFSAALSGPLTFSGPMSFSGNSGHGPYSGSVSHRSDSSTASTHSFAFPILPYEWNSSPVKMAQPDKRFMQRPWKRRLRSLFCCADPYK